MVGQENEGRFRSLGHRMVPMVGRDPDAEHRQATPLELLFDLTFVVAFGIAGEQFAHLYAEGHYGSGLFAFAFACFAIVWAWISYSWFASAFDTQDWVFRLLTMMQMAGVVVLALGLPQMFHAVDSGQHLGNEVMVAGYVVMRVAMVLQWLRAAREGSRHRDACIAYAVGISLAQAGWVTLAVVQPPLGAATVVALALILFELATPLFAQSRRGGTPWHPSHIAERYGLLTIITLGEGVIGTVASLSAVVDETGWSTDAVLIAIAGTGLTFGLWWMYFIVPAARVLRRRRNRAMAWGYLHIPLLAALAATGAGLHVAAYFIEGETHIGATSVVVSVALPVGVFVICLYGLHTALVREGDPFHLALMASTALVLGAAVALSAVGVALSVCFLMVMLAPVVTVVGFELVGHRHVAVILERIEAHS
ncbi:MULTISPECIES: low temperature requirement protein A [Nocardioides]|uniref:Low temperature requirement protein A n=1 Tax=Nocardioides vastitatis TaxID=2568655 RepID=A0ABW0ZPJ6_9ACTN|nr:low temperature requirement protein A [Nocardioides sp.]